MGRDREKNIKTLDTLTEALGMSEGQTPEEIKADIADEGIDVDAALARLKDARLSISMAAKRSALDAAREKRHKLIKKEHEFIGKFSDWTKDQIIERINELSGPEAGLAFRDLEAMGTEEMASILEDLELAYQITMKENDDSE